jgi:hypothetical protein
VDARLTEALAQLMGNGLPLCPGRRHSVDEALDVAGKVMVTVFGKQTSDGAPAVFDLASCFYKRALAGFDASAALQEFNGYGFGLCADVSGIAALACSIDAVFLGFPIFAADGAFGGVGLDAEQS